MGYIIILRGPAGVGKTTIAKKLSKILNAEDISIDRIMKENEWNYIPGEKCIPEEKYLIANELIKKKIKGFIKNNKNIIIENNFYHKSQIVDLLNDINIKTYIFTLKANHETCIKRNKTRKRPMLDKEVIAVHNLVSRFDYGNILDTDNKTEEEVVNEILSIINK
jgi:tRNA uridine 5-carbamoylmethylation protein Kti12